jgi:hypothetical protein
VNPTSYPTDKPDGWWDAQSMAIVVSIATLVGVVLIIGAVTIYFKYEPCAKCTEDPPTNESVEEPLNPMPTAETGTT